MIDCSVGGSDTTVCVADVEYESATPPLVYDRPAVEAPDFLADDALGLVYAGDFTSSRAPGFEAATLAGLDAAEHLVRVHARAT